MHLLLHVLNGGISSFGEHVLHVCISISEEASVVCNAKSTATVSSLPNREINEILKKPQSMHSCKRPSQYQQRPSAGVSPDQ